MIKIKGYLKHLSCHYNSDSTQEFHKWHISYIITLKEESQINLL